MLKRRWMWMVATLLIGGTIAAMSRPTPRRATDNPFANQTTADATDKAADGATDEESAGQSVVHSPYGEDPGQRKAIADLQKQIDTESEATWTKRFALTERSGQTISSDELKGQPFVASFFFSRCPGSCKQQNDQMRLLQEKYRDTPLRLVSISVDPEADTPEVLSQYAANYGADKNRWLFFTGDIGYIQKIAGEFFLLGQVSLRGHPDRFCLVDASGRLVGKYNWHDADELKQLDAHIAEVLGERTSSSAQ